MAEIPPWLSQGPAYGQLYATGAKLGADIGAQNAQTSIERTRILQNSGIEQARLAQTGVLERAKLAQEAQRTSQNYQIAQDELEQRRERAAREDMVRQQQLEIEKAYKDQMISLQQQELEQKKRAMDEKISQAAQQYQAQQQFKDMIQAAGENPNIMNIAAQSGLMGRMTGQGISSMAKAFQPRPQATLPTNATYGGQPFAQWTNPNGNLQLKQISVPKALGQAGTPTEATYGGQPFVQWNQPSGALTMRQIHTPTTKDTTGNLTQKEKARLVVLKSERDLLMKNLPSPMLDIPALVEQRKTGLERIKTLNDEINTITQSSDGGTGSKIGDYTWEIVDEGDTGEED